MSFPHLGDVEAPVPMDIGRQETACRGVNDNHLGEAMKLYCYVLNREDRVNALETLEGSNDNEAFGTAQCYLAQNPSIRSVEVWLERRYVGKIHRN
jgi:hypothetical protein